MPAKPIAGTLYLRAGELNLSVAGQFTFKPSTPTREPKVGLSGPAGYVETQNFAMLEGSIFRTQAVTLQQLGNLAGVAVTFDRQDGSSVVLPDAFVTEQPEMDEATGEIKISFAAATSEETTA